jgi:hypothetical protein
MGTQIEERVIWREGRETFEDNGLEEWSDAVKNQGIPASALSWKRQGVDSPIEPAEEAQTSWHFNSGPLLLILDLWPLELWENKFLIFYVTKFVAIYYCSQTLEFG